MHCYLVFAIFNTSFHFINSHQTEKSLEYTTDRSMRAQQINLSYTTGDCEKLEFSKIAPQAVNSINEDTVKI